MSDAILLTILIGLIEDDSYASTFSSMGQYRKRLLEVVEEYSKKAGSSDTEEGGE